MHIKPQWPLRFKHRCTKVITIVSKKIKYPLPLKILHSITKRNITTKYHNTEYRNLPTPNIHEKGKTILHSDQLLPKNIKDSHLKSIFSVTYFLKQASPRDLTKYERNNPV